VQARHKNKQEFFDNLWKATKNVIRKMSGDEPKKEEKKEEPKPAPPPPPAPEPKKEEPKKEEPKKEEPKKEEPMKCPAEPKKEVLDFPTYEGKRPMPSTKDSIPEKNETVAPAPINETAFVPPTITVPVPPKEPEYVPPPPPPAAKDVKVLKNKKPIVPGQVAPPPQPPKPVVAPKEKPSPPPETP